MTDFSIHTAASARLAFPAMIRNPETREELTGADSVEREADNAGTFILNENAEIIAFVCNSHSINGEWLYYSSDVRRAYIL